jgi:probable rRNA maturation factor
LADGEGCEPAFPFLFGPEIWLRNSGLVILQKKVVGLSEASLSRFVMRARGESRLRGRVNVLVTGSAAMRTLNARFRGKNKPTDVLSFPCTQAHAGRGKGKPGFAGEIAISADIAAQNAARLGHSVASEVKVLALHGILHLAGMDHEHDNGQMARKEAELRRVLRLPATLTERGGPALKGASSRGRRKGGRTA